MIVSFDGIVRNLIYGDKEEKRSAKLFVILLVTIESIFLIVLFLF